MNNNSLQISIFICVLTVACNTREAVLDGVYKNTVHTNSSSHLNTTHTLIYNLSLFKNGYWVGTCFMKGYVFECSGGTYKKIKDKYIRTFNFTYEDQTVAGKTDTFTYAVNGDNHLLGGL